MFRNDRLSVFGALLQREPNAFASIQGSRTYHQIRGLVRFYQTASGVIVATEVSGLPSPRGRCEAPIFGFHIHEGSSCSGNDADPFADALTHYDPHQCPHPYHAGDLPPLFGVRGTAVSVFLTGRFTVRETIGKTVIIHSNPDDFTTQPAGNAGTKIACGKIFDSRTTQS